MIFTAPTSAHDDRRGTVIVALLLLLIVLARAPSFLFPCVNIDEADFAVQAAVWQDGGKPYIDFVEKKPPIIHLLYAAAFGIGGTWNMLAVHALFALLSAATGLVLWKTTEAAGGKRTGIAALALFAAYSAGYDLNDFLMAGTEIPMNLAAAAAAYAAVTAFARENRRRHLLAAGFFTGIAALAKPVAAAFLPAIIAADAFSRFEHPRTSPHRAMSILSDASFVLAGLAIPIAVAALLLFNAGALDDATRWIWTENFSYAQSALPLSMRLKHGAVRLGTYVLVSLPLWVLALGRIAKAIRDRAPSAIDLLAGTWILCALCACALGWRFFPHYFLQFLPPLIILASLGWTSWLEPALAARKTATTAALLIGWATPMIAFPLLQTLQAQQLPHRLVTEQAIAHEVAERTSPTDRVFVWGHSSDIYLFSRRLPASRFVYCSFLTGASEGYEQHNRIGEQNLLAWKLLMLDLARHAPQLIIDMSGTNIRGYGAYPIEAFPELRSFVHRRYRLEGTVAGARLFRRT